MVTAKDLCRRLWCLALMLLSFSFISVAVAAPEPSAALDIMALRADALRLERQQSNEALYEPAKKRLSQKWLPRLLKAEADGDKLASYILRSCAAWPALDRSGIDSGCTGRPSAAVENALADILGLASADMSALDFSFGGLQLSSEIPSCAGLPDELNCMLNAWQELMARHRDIFVKTAFIEAMPERSHGYAYDCRPRVLKVEKAEACKNLRHLLMAAKTLAPRYFRTSLLPSTLSAADRMSELPYANLNDIGDREGPQVGEADKVELFESNSRFYTEVYALLLAMDAHISARLKQDPRWKVFLENAPAGTYRRLQQKKLSLARGDAYVGAYEGPLVSNGT